MIGVFVALDLFLFYFFWEATLIPMALLIGMYGHGRKIYAAVKFFLYTMIASMFMLAAIIWLYAHTGSFDFVDDSKRDSERTGSGSSAGGAVAVPGILRRVCGEGAAVPGTHLAAGRARGSADRRIGAAGGRAAEDGHLWPVALQCRTVPGAGAAQRSVDHDAGDYRHHLWRAGGDDSAQHQAAGRVHVGQPPGICGAGDFQLHADGRGRRGLPDAESRRLDRRALHAAGNDVRSPPHLRTSASTAAWRRRCRCSPPSSPSSCCRRWDCRC